jgi:hypothetical protein
VTTIIRDRKVTPANKNVTFIQILEKKRCNCCLSKENNSQEVPVLWDTSNKLPLSQNLLESS